MKKMSVLRMLSLMVSIGAAWLIGGCSGDPVISKSIAPLRLEVTVVSGDPASVVVDKDHMGDSGLNRESGSELSNLSYISGGRLNTYLFSGMSVVDVVNIHKDVSKVEDNTDIRTMRLFINSPGGSAFAGLAIADMINQASSRGWTVEANATGIVASAAVPVFAVCSPRYAAEGTLFMVHEAALWKWPGKETASDIRAQQKLMIVLQDQYLSYLIENSNLDHASWVEKERATTWFTAAEALSWGLVDDIR